MWGEEELAPTWAELIRQQAPDLLLFTAFAVLVLISFRKKTPWLKTLTLAVTVGYLGIYKSQIVSIVNVYGLLSWNLPVLQYSMGWYLFATFTLASTILWGRLYCGRMCAFGALTQLIDRVAPRRWRYNIPLRVERRINYIKYGILAGILGYFFATKNILAFRFVEPFWMFTGHAPMGTTLLWVGIAALLVASVFVSNLYCRLLCPVGAFLGVISSVTTVFRIKRWSECNTCRICEKACEWGAIDGKRIIKSECVRCDDCERLYHNEKKCPHHIILIRKADIMARRSVAPIAQAAP